MSRSPFVTETEAATVANKLVAIVRALEASGMSKQDAAISVFGCVVGIVYASGAWTADELGTIATGVARVIEESKTPPPEGERH